MKTLCYVLSAAFCYTIFFLLSFLSKLTTLFFLNLTLWYKLLAITVTWVFLFFFISNKEMERGEEVVDGLGRNKATPIPLYSTSDVSHTDSLFEPFDWSLFTELGKKERILVMPVVV